ncbi:MAG TPA: CotH kinase family protein [Thermoanaerobaculia bacterium]|jgi:hypothetical protein
MKGLARRRLGGALIALAAAAVLAAAADSGFVRALERRLARDEVAAPLEVRNRLRAQLRGLLHVQAPESPHALEPLGADGRCPAPRLGTRPTSPELMPSSWRAPGGEWLARGRTLVSLAVDRCRLRWLHEHRFGHGRRFEELGWVSIFEDGELRFASPVGVRMHGHTGRQRAPFNYRLYFRRAFGGAELPASWIDPQLAGNLDEVVLKRDLGPLPGGRPWPFVESVAFAVARRLGAHAPGFRPVALSLNGQTPLTYAVSERITKPFLLRRFGDGDFEIVPGKVHSRQREAARLRQLQHWVREAPLPLRADHAAERFDMPSLLDSLVTALVVGAGDAFQDALVRDRRGERLDGRWFFVLWDHDFGFRDSPRFKRFPGGAPDLLPMLVAPAASFYRVPEMLVRRLQREDAAFRGLLTRRLATAFNHELTPEFFAALVAEHERLAEEVGLADRSFLAGLREALDRRPRELFDQLERLLGAAPFQPLEVVSSGPRFRVDGHEATRRFRGWSSVDAPVRLEIVGDDRERFAGWYAGERLVSDAPVLETGDAAAVSLAARAGSTPQRSRPTG